MRAPTFDYEVILPNVFFLSNRGKSIVCKKCTAPTQTTESPLYGVLSESQNLILIQPEK